MERSEIKPHIAKRVAKELHDGDVVKTLVSDFLLWFEITLIHLLNLHYSLRTDSSVLRLLIGRSGCFAHIGVNAGGQPAGIEKDGMFFDSATSFSIIHVVDML
ncbi:MAG: hypothetical protein ACLUD0_07070 [Eubacterium ramulus]